MYLLDMDVTVSPLFSLLLKTDLLITILIDIYCRSLEIERTCGIPFSPSFQDRSLYKTRNGCYSCALL